MEETYPPDMDYANYTMKEYDEEDDESDDDEDDIRVEDVNESTTPRESDKSDEPVVEDIGETTDLQ